MTYSELLLSKEWKEKRNDILNRDFFRCSICYNEKLLNDFQKGILLKKVPNSNFILVKYFSLDKNKWLTIFDTQAIKVNYPSFILFSEQNDNIFISGSRDLSSQEKERYTRSIQTFMELKTNNRFWFQDSEHFKKCREIYKDEMKIYFCQSNTELEIDLSNIKWNFMNGLHVHHKFYQKGKLPWEYENEALVTVCWHCHEELHSNKKIPYLDENGIKIGTLTPCTRCHGAGWFPEYNHVENGICFRCEGAMYEEFLSH